MIKFIALFIIFCAVLTVAPQSFAQDCKPLYGGGVTKQQTCDGKKVTASPTPQKTKATPTPTKKKTETTSKGGLPVISPAPQKATPSTGPELLGLIALVPAAAFGLFLRNRS